MISLRGLCVSRGNFRFGPLDLDVAEGEVLVVIGPSASGKSTLLDLVAGFCHADAGTLHLDGVSSLLAATHERPIAWISQADTIFPHLSVKQNIAYGLVRRRQSSAEIDAAVAEVATRTEVTHLLDRMPDGLSGGERQRVAFARAIVTTPRVLLCDEPFSALDRGSRLQLQKLLVRLQSEQGFALLHVTHDLEEAKNLGARVALLSDGRLLASGSLDEVLAQPASRDVALKLGAAEG